MVGKGRMDSPFLRPNNDSGGLRGKNRSNLQERRCSTTTGSETKNRWPPITWPRFDAAYDVCALIGRISAPPRTWLEDERAAHDGCVGGGDAIVIRLWALKRYSRVAARGSRSWPSGATRSLVECVEEKKCAAWRSQENTCGLRDLSFRAFGYTRKIGRPSCECTSRAHSMAIDRFVDTSRM